MADLGAVAWPPAPITTDRFVLRESEARDRAAFIELFASPEVETYIAGPRPRNEFQRAIPELPGRRPGYFVVDLDGTMMGMVTLGGTRLVRRRASRRAGGALQPDRQRPRDAPRGEAGLHGGGTVRGAGRRAMVRRQAPRSRPPREPAPRRGHVGTSGGTPGCPRHEPGRDRPSIVTQHLAPSPANAPRRYGVQQGQVRHNLAVLHETTAASLNSSLQVGGAFGLAVVTAAIAPAPTGRPSAAARTTGSRTGFPARPGREECIGRSAWVRVSSPPTRAPQHGAVSARTTHGLAACRWRAPLTSPCSR